MKPLNWGIIGAARFAAEHMAPAIHAARHNRLIALATSSAEKAAPFLALTPDLRLHDSYEALLADPQIEAVYIPLPNHLHVEWTLKAIAAGKHVLCEKPMALRAEDYAALIASRDASGLVVAEAFMILHHPQWARARAWLDAGEIGTLRHADVAFSFHNPDPANIRNRPETGGGSLPDIGVYAFGALRLLTGAEPVEISARIRQENGVEVFAQVAATMAGGGHAFTYGAMTSMRLYNRQVVTLQGDRGMIRLEGGCFNAGVNDQAEVELHQDGTRVTVERFPRVNQYVTQVEAFAASVRSGAPYAVPLEFSRGTQAMIDRAQACAQVINVKPNPPDPC